MSLRLPNPMIGVVWLAFFIPAASGAEWAGWSFAVAVFLLACAVLAGKPSPWETRKSSALAFRIFLTLEILYVFSSLYSAAFNGVQFGLRDFFELLRYVVLGTFTVYVIRHYDGRVRLAVEWAMTAAVYAALLLPAIDSGGYVAVMSLCYLLFFSRLRLRHLHAAAALLVVIFSGSRASLTAGLFVLSAALAVGLYRSLARRGVKFAARASVALYAALLAGTAVLVRSDVVAGGYAAAASAGRILQFIRRSPIFGWGPAQNQGIPFGDDQYLRWLLNGGALGEGVILSGLCIAAYRLLRDLSGDLPSLAGGAAFLGSVGLMLASGQFLESFRLFFLTVFFMAGMFEAARLKGAAE